MAMGFNKNAEVEQTRTIAQLLSFFILLQQISIVSDLRQLVFLRRGAMEANVRIGHKMKCTMKLRRQPMQTTQTFKPYMLRRQ